MRLAFQGGKLPSKEELAGDELIQQMIKEAEEKGKTEALKDVPTKEKVLQDLKVEDIPEAIRQTITKDVPTKETIMQGLTEADVPEAIKQKIIEESKTVPPVIENFVKQVAGLVKGSQGGSVNDNGEKKKSLLQRHREESAAFGI